MANLLYRASSTAAVPGSTTVKGLALTNSEIDGNFRSLNLGKVEETDAVSTSTANKVVRRDASGNFSANVITVVDLNSTSDRELKDNITPIVDPMAILNQLEGVGFTWKHSGEQSYGIIAQELEKVLPELVTQVDGYKMVSYIPIIAFLIQAIKSQQVEIDKLKNT
jgi:hypothetical protein